MAYRNRSRVRRRGRKSMRRRGRPMSRRRRGRSLKGYRVSRGGIRL